MTDDPAIFCYGCGRTPREVLVLVTIERIRLCNDCIEECHSAVMRHVLEKQWAMLKDFAP